MTDDGRTWIAALIRHFPELIEELAPSRSRTLRDLPGRAPAGPAAPIRLYVSDTIRDVTDGVVELEEAVRERLGLREVATAPVPVRLRRIAGVLDHIAAHPDLLAHVTDETRRMARRCARALGDPEQLVRVAGRCPLCDSVSLRAFPERATVMCVNPPCRHVLKAPEEADAS
ncbi:hypothetical protein [Streptomyces sp. NPDC050504]|uniref:hypothetical protein n=1 Tax=Streptomyces sp. NPDC050504 TaxID=3365618 RepID=UPI0037BA06E0